MLASDKKVDHTIHSVVTDDPMTCCCCGRKLTSQRQRMRGESKVYCRVCYGRLMFPDLREADMEFLD